VTQGRAADPLRAAVRIDLVVPAAIGEPDMIEIVFDGYVVSLVPPPVAAGRSKQRSINP
jgi:hypothetical protein